MRAIELNGCSGGMAKGMRDADIEFTWSFDWDVDACASYERNLGHRPVRMDIRDVVRMVRGGWSPGALDLLVADPPCTPWSRAGKRKGVTDERDMLEETCELISLLRPRAFLIGNVPGLQDSTSWNVVQRVIGGLAKHGYCVADYQQLDAADYGVPQRRIRPFWFGHLAGPCIAWPSPTHAAPSRNLSLGMMGLRPWVTCREALGHLPPEEMGRPVRLRSAASKDHHPNTPERPSKALSTNTMGDGALMVNERHRPAEPDRPAPTVAAKVRGQGAQVLRADQHGHPTSKLDSPAWTLTAEGGRAGKRSSVLERAGSHAWPWDRPSTIVFCDDRIAPPGHHDGSFLSARERRWDRPQSQRVYSPDETAPTVQTKEDRPGSGAVTLDWPWGAPPQLGDNATQPGPNAIVLSESAASILQGFPRGWVFVGKTKRSRWSQLGQAMPPALASAVGRSISAQLRATDAERPLSPLAEKECA